MASYPEDPRRNIGEESVPAREMTLTERTQSFLEDQLHQADMATQKCSAYFQEADAEIARRVDVLNEAVAEFNRINELYRHFMGQDIPDPIRYAVPPEYPTQLKVESAERQGVRVNQASTSDRYPRN